MKKENRTPAPGYDVSDYGARQRVKRFIMDRLFTSTSMLGTISHEEEALRKEGYNPNALILVDRIGDTAIFLSGWILPRPVYGSKCGLFRVSVSEPILVNGDGEVRDLNEPMRKWHQEIEAGPWNG